MGDENPIRTLGDYSKPSHEGYRNTIELLDPNQHLKDFLKLVDSLDLDGENRERARLHLFQFSLRDQASNWLERLLAGSISTWEDHTTRFLAQFFPPGRTAKLRNDILMFQQHHGESLSEAWTQDLALYDNESWNDPRDFGKPVKAITLPQGVSSTSDRCLIELKTQVQCLMEAHLAPTQPTQVNKITTSCEICSGPHDTQYCMEDPEQAFVEYASSRTDEAGEGMVSEFMASQDARLSKFEADFKRQQGEMTNKIDIEDDGEVMFIEIIRDDDEPQNEDPNEGEGATTEETIVEYFDTFPTWNELTYHRLYLMRRSLEFLKKFHWMILGGRFNQLSRVSSLLLSKPWEY
ncbi:MAK10-like protein [Tanacetum coccineum]